MIEPAFFFLEQKHQKNNPDPSHSVNMIYQSTVTRIAPIRSASGLEQLQAECCLAFACPLSRLSSELSSAVAFVRQDYPWLLPGLPIPDIHRCELYDTG